MCYMLCTVCSVVCKSSVTEKETLCLMRRQKPILSNTRFQCSAPPSAVWRVGWAPSISSWNLRATEKERREMKSPAASSSSPQTSSLRTSNASNRPSTNRPPIQWWAILFYRLTPTLFRTSAIFADAIAFAFALPSSITRRTSSSVIEFRFSRIGAISASMSSISASLSVL